MKELAELCNVPVDTVRHYTRIGLLQPDRDPVNGYHKYCVSDSKRLDFIKKAKNLGYSLKEIEQILAESRKGKSPCPLVRELISQRIEENRAHLEQLMEMQIRMEKALASWERMPDGIPDGDSICHLIESMDFNQDS
ncbi:MAG: MerR family transcriptional regulator [Gammaproteobacteria bacterium]